VDDDNFKGVRKTEISLNALVKYLTVELKKLKKVIKVINIHV
jgi:hypothetical protein